MSKVFFVTGASGSGKTSIIRNIKEEKGIARDKFILLNFDDIGIPESWEGIDGEKWQKETTEKWMDIIKNKYGHYPTVVIEGSSKIPYIEGAFELSGIRNGSIILIDCDDETRTQRLTGRGQPGLADEGMMNFARQFREHSKGRDNVIVMETTGRSLDDCTKELKDIVFCAKEKGVTEIGF